ncbi:S8 family peptidase [Deinococcus humi]|uniref:Subtilisin n=1 Tax=Deinococcus humi TaxID=662880 RepID=A0A7W8JYZ0_9DEIO|nr:S8 family serine peptidase [Deinococcus humi]MBB5365795.1 subtilisin [Deinococcus humi]GGO39267.1 hypothetical protein GCM10008949_47080 [Deinococcus humi]
MFHLHRLTSKVVLACCLTIGLTACPGPVPPPSPSALTVEQWALTEATPGAAFIAEMSRAPQGTFQAELTDVDGERTPLTVDVQGTALQLRVPVTASGGFQQLRLTGEGQTFEQTVTVLGSRGFVDDTRVLALVQAETARTTFEAALAAQGLALASGGWRELDGDAGPCADRLAVVGTGGAGVGETLARLRALPGVRVADAEGLFKVDPASLWDRGLINVRFYYKRAIGNGDTTGSGVTVAVLDTGIRADDPEFPASEDPADPRRVLPGRNFVNVSAAPNDDFRFSFFGHGNSVAQMIAGLQRGVASGSEVLPVKVCDESGVCRTSHIVQGLCYAMSAAAPGRTVLNLSFGADVPSEIMRRALVAATDADTLIAAAVGNEAAGQSESRTVSKQHFPASYDLPGVLVVGALESVDPPFDVSDGNGGSEDLFADVSGWKRATTSRKAAALDVVAPGVIRFTDDTVQVPNGTSFATPLAAGALAQWREACPTASPTALVIQIKADAVLTNIREADRNATSVGTGLLQLRASATRCPEI